MQTQIDREEIDQVAITQNILKTFDIKKWTSTKIYRRGLNYFREDRVIYFEINDDNTIRAEVEGSEIYSVDIGWEEDGTPLAQCSCPYDWEPICKHAVAAILFWQERWEGGEDLDKEEGKGSSEDFYFDREGHIAELAELESRKRGSKKSLESIKILKRPKGSLFGKYTVTSATVKETYTVMVRDVVDLSYTTCSCRDYLINELGTCKHIELVKEDLDKKLKRRGGNRRSDSRVWISLQPKNTYNCGLSPYEEIHIHASDKKIRESLFSEEALAGKLWTTSGYILDSFRYKMARAKFKKVISEIKGCFGNGHCPEIVISEQVLKLLADIDADCAWRARSDKVIGSPKTSVEWKSLKKELSIKLYNYQEEGVLFAVRNRRSFIGDDMGLGKTIQAIVSALFVKRLAGIGKVLIFCPASLKFQWQREIEKISGEHAQIVQGNRLVRQKIYKESQAMFLIVNYELIFRDEELLHELGPDMVILDEAQRIKNWETKTAKGIKRLKSEFALILTGTPFENRLVELHSLCEFLHTRALGPMWRVLPTYGNLDANDKLIGFSNLSQLRQRIAPFFLRREKEAVLGQLPERVTNEYAIEIGSAQLSYHDDYQAMLAKLLSIQKKRPLTSKEIKRAFMCLTCMRIISNALAQYDWEKHAHMVNTAEPLSLKQIRSLHSPKLLEFRSIMEDLLTKPNTKFVIFSQWERMLMLAEATIRELLVSTAAESVIFSGSLPTRLRPNVIDRFISDPRLRIFFSTDAGGLGLNLQESASYVINLDMPWNPAVLEQRVARVHRIGQKKTVNVVNLISTGCIEERVYDAIGNKRLLFDGVFDGKTDSIEFEKGSAFIDRLKDVMGDEFGDGEKIEIRSEVVENLEKSEGHTIDLTGLVNVLGSWIGNQDIAQCRPEAFKIKVAEKDGELNLTLRKPPKELVSGVKKLLSTMLKAIEVGST